MVSSRNLLSRGLFSGAMPVFGVCKSLIAMANFIKSSCYQVLGQVLFHDNFPFAYNAWIKWFIYHTNQNLKKKNNWNPTGKLHSGRHVDPKIWKKDSHIGNPPLVRAFSNLLMGNLSGEYQLIWHKYTDSTINWPYRYGWYMVAFFYTPIYAISIYGYCGNLDVVGPINHPQPPKAGLPHHGFQQKGHCQFIVLRKATAPGTFGSTKAIWFFGIP